MCFLRPPGPPLDLGGIRLGCDCPVVGYPSRSRALSDPSAGASVGHCQRRAGKAPSQRPRSGTRDFKSTPTAGGNPPAGRWSRPGRSQASGQPAPRPFSRCRPWPGHSGHWPDNRPAGRPRNECGRGQPFREAPACQCLARGLWPSRDIDNDSDGLATAAPESGLRWITGLKVRVTGRPRDGALLLGRGRRPCPLATGRCLRVRSRYIYSCGRRGRLRSRPGGIGCLPGRGSVSAQAGKNLRP